MGTKGTWQRNKTISEKDFAKNWDKIFNKEQKMVDLESALKHFKKEEYRDWWSQMNPKLVVLSDIFREFWGDSVLVSPVNGAIGRHKGDSSTQHNVDKWGMVNATDYMIPSLETWEGYWKAYELAKQVGFTGIGVYPHWKPHPGLHLDVRPDRVAGNPAEWGALDVDKCDKTLLEFGNVVGSQVYLDIETVINTVKE